MRLTLNSYTVATLNDFDYTIDDECVSARVLRKFLIKLKLRNWQLQIEKQHRSRAAAAAAVVRCI